MAFGVCLCCALPSMECPDSVKHERDHKANMSNGTTSTSLSTRSTYHWVDKDHNRSESTKLLVLLCAAVDRVVSAKQVGPVVEPLAHEGREHHRTHDGEQQVREDQEHVHDKIGRAHV